VPHRSTCSISTHEKIILLCRQPVFTSSLTHWRSDQIAFTSYTTYTHPTTRKCLRHCDLVYYLGPCVGCQGDMCLLECECAHSVYQMLL
jgi:hypothetical protein